MPNICSEHTEKDKRDPSMTVTADDKAGVLKATVYAFLPVSKVMQE